jgi:putative chitinase
MVWGEGDDKQFAMFELTPSFSKRGAVEVKWFQAYPLRQGVGSRAMKELQALAREDGITLTLFPWDKGQVSQAKLTKFYKQQGFQSVHKGSKSLYWVPQDELEEGWKDWVAGAALGAAALSGTPVDAKVTPIEKPAIVQPASSTKIANTNSPLEQILINTAKRSGMKGAELAQFLAQTKHESWDFSRMKEKGGSLDFRKYDPKYAPRTAKILGNKHIGDGAKYKGRGFIQITGRNNYTAASKDLGIDLVNHPELAEKPDVAIKVSFWYCKTRVQSKISNFGNTKAVTKKVNGGVNGLQQRTKLTKSFQVANK